jgi:stage V sporulation protein B
VHHVPGQRDFAGQRLREPSHFHYGRGCAAKLIVNNILYGTAASALRALGGPLVCYALIAVLELVAINGGSMPASYLRVFVKPLAAALLMGGAVWGIYGLLSGTIGWEIPSHSGRHRRRRHRLCDFGAVLRVISKDDLALMPKGDKIRGFLRVQS